MNERTTINVVDVFVFSGEIHRVIEIPVMDERDGLYKFIDIKTGQLVPINEKEISMRMTFREFTPEMNMHDNAKALIVKYFAN